MQPSRQPSSPPSTPRPSPAFLRRFFRRDTFAARAGITVLEIRPGYARARLKVGPQHWNGVDVVQGGAVFTLADLAFAIACNTAGPVALAINVSISFLRAVSSGTLTAEAREVSRTSRLSTVEVEVTDEAGAPVALFHGTAYVTKETLVEAVARGRQPRRARRPLSARTAPRRPTPARKEPRRAR